MPKISVIIPVYNTEKYLPQCLDSVINQGLKDIEIICVDDGSKDNSGKILDEYAKKDKRIKVVHKQNEGAGAARNTGLEYATGEFVLFFDSDDYILDGAFEKMYTHAQAKDADITICRSLKCIDEEKQLSPISYSINKQRLKGKTDFSPKDISDEIYQFCVGWPWDKLYKLSFIKENKLAFQNLRHSNDTFFVLFSLSLAEKISILEEALVVHRTHSSSLAATRSKAPDCFYFALLKLREGLKDRNLYNCFEKSFINYCITFSAWHFETINDDEAQKAVFAKIIELLQLIDFEKYPRDYFYFKKEYEVIRQLYSKKMPKVSIIIPTYNVEKYLRECMDSVVNQTLQDIEIICVDDGAKDNSGKILDEYAQKDKRIKVIHKANGGYGKAMNVGLDNATGEYVGIVEPDDFVELNMYETLYNTAKEHDVDFVKGNYYGYLENNNKNDLKVTFDKKNVYNVIIKPLEHIETFRGGACIWSALYNHKFLTEKKIRFLETPGASFQDTSFEIRTLFEAKKALYIKDAHYHYRMDNPTSSVKDNSKIFCICDELEFLDKLYSSDKYKRDIINSLKLDKYNWNYQRLGSEGKKEFAKKYCKDISNILKNKNYNAQFTFPAAIEMAKKNIAENNHPIFANIFSKKVKYKNGKKITRYLGGIIKKVKNEKSKKVYLLGVQIYHKHKKEKHVA